VVVGRVQCDECSIAQRNINTRQSPEAAVEDSKDGFKHAKNHVESSDDDEGRSAHPVAHQLLTWKQFMQRSAHKATAASPSTPNGPASKKVRLSNGHSAPGTADHEIIQSAVILEEKKRQEALEKASQHAGETKWVLSFKDPLDGKRQESLQVRQAGFAEIDAADDSEEEEEARPIRKQFGGGLKRKEVCVVTQPDWRYLLTRCRSLWLLKKPKIPMGRSSRLPKNTIAMTPRPHSYERRSAKWLQKNVNLIIHRHGRMTIHLEEHPMET
jgi:hypothetical protein